MSACSSDEILHGEYPRIASALFCMACRAKYSCIILLNKIYMPMFWFANIHSVTCRSSNMVSIPIMEIHIFFNGSELHCEVASCFDRNRRQPALHSDPAPCLQCLVQRFAISRVRTDFPGKRRVTHLFDGVLEVGGVTLGYRFWKPKD